MKSFPILGALGLIFITLKLTHIINWPWLWVLAPFWIPACIALAFGAFVLAIFLLAAISGAPIKISRVAKTK